MLGVINKEILLHQKKLLRRMRKDRTKHEAWQFHYRYLLSRLQLSRDTSSNIMSHAPNIKLIKPFSSFIIISINNLCSEKVIANERVTITTFS